MKNNTTLFLLFIAAFAANCSRFDDSVTTISDSDNGEVGYIYASIDDAATRVEINGTDVRWRGVNQDYIVLVRINDDGKEFASCAYGDTSIIVADSELYWCDEVTEDGKSALFKGEALEEGAKYIALTSNSFGFINEDLLLSPYLDYGQLLLITGAETQYDNGICGVSYTWQMTSPVFTASSEDVPTLKFTHNQAMMELDIKIEAGASKEHRLASIFMNSDERYFYSRAVLTTEGDIYISKGWTSGGDNEVLISDEINGDSNLIGSESNYKVYVSCFINEDASLGEDSTFDFTIYTDEGYYSTVSVEARELEVGRLYTKELVFEEPKNPEQQYRDALIAFYNATGGDNWTDNTNWCSEEPLSEWYGVTTDSEFDWKVTMLELQNNNLVGTIPSEIGDLTELTWLSIGSESGMTGEIPAEIGKLKHLATFYIRYTSIGGAIPAEIGECRSLEWVNFYMNKFTSIPDEIGNIDDLININLAYNEFSGELPTAFSRIRGIYTLYLNDNNFSGAIPEEFGNMPTLKCLTLDYNNLTGEIPASFGYNMPCLQPELSGQPTGFIGNKLTGEVPPYFYSTPELWAEWESFWETQSQQKGYGLTMPVL